jgi:hypothetical protein
MSDAEKVRLVRFELTQGQRETAQRVTARDVEAIELTVEELEERIAPRLASNHNETLLAER